MGKFQFFFSFLSFVSFYCSSFHAMMHANPAVVGGGKVKNERGRDLVERLGGKGFSLKKICRLRDDNREVQKGL